MSRLLVLFAIVAVVYLLFRSYRKNASAQDKTDAEDMVRCAHCGVHLPRSESIRAEGRDFCSAEHRDAYRK
ncbi:MAG: PP0621 family protein [Gallionella sp.]